MAKLEFRDLRADEIDCRISTVSKDDQGNITGMSLLLYKDARCDMNILDETVGAYNWQREHSRDNANCTVAIWDEDKKQWIRKEDTGTESQTEAEKGLASDSFKRACFNWGIGRELYTAPFIWIEKENIKNKYDKFRVQSITIKDKKIIGLVIYSITKKKVVYTMGSTQTTQTTQTQQAQAPKTTTKTTTKTEPKQETTQQAEDPEKAKAREKYQLLIEYCNENGLNIKKIAAENGLTADSTAQDFEMALVYARTIVLTGGAS